MTGDFLDPFVQNNKELNKCYYNTLKSVKLGLPDLYKDILKFVCDLAQAELDKALGKDEEKEKDDADADKNSDQSYEFEYEKEEK